MDRRTFLTLLFTFFVGCFAGAYLYVTAFAPAFVRDDFQPVAEIDFKLQGEMYGGCQMTGQCPVFTLGENRKFVFDMPIRSGSDADTVTEGRLDTDTYTDLLATISAESFTALTAKNELSCASYVDGADYRYLLTYEGEQYALDTCGMHFGSTSLAREFQLLWSAMQENENGSSGGSIGDLLENELDKRFEYDE